MTLAAHSQHHKGQRYLAEDGSPLQVGLRQKISKEELLIVEKWAPKR